MDQIAEDHQGNGTVVREWHIPDRECSGTTNRQFQSFLVIRLISGRAYPGGSSEMKLFAIRSYRSNMASRLFVPKPKV